MSKIYGADCKACRIGNFTERACLRPVVPCQWLVISDAPTNAELACEEAGIGAHGEVVYKWFKDCGVAVDAVVITHAVACRR